MADLLGSFLFSQPTVNVVFVLQHSPLPPALGRQVKWRDKGHWWWQLGKTQRKGRKHLAQELLLVINRMNSDWNGHFLSYTRVLQLMSTGILTVVITHILIFTFTFKDFHTLVLWTSPELPTPVLVLSPLLHSTARAMEQSQSMASTRNDDNTCITYKINHIFLLSVCCKCT